MAVLDIQEATLALAEDPAVRGRLVRDFALTPASDAPEDLVATLLEAFDQAPLENPLRRPPSPTELFRAAVRALGSNSRRWSTFLAAEPDLADLLHQYDPDRVVSDIEAGSLDVDRLLPYFPGITGRADAAAVLGWSRKAHERHFAHQIEATVRALRDRHDQLFGQPLARAHLMPLVVAFLVSPTRRLGVVQWMFEDHEFEAGLWKLPGMGPALGSELFRNLGWDGFKPDRHVMRLLDRWCPTVVAEQKRVGRALAEVLGRRDRSTLDYLTYSLAGQTVSPANVSFSIVDNLIWALGAYVEKKGSESSRTYLRSSGTGGAEEALASLDEDGAGVRWVATSDSDFTGQAFLTGIVGEAPSGLVVEEYDPATDEIQRQVVVPGYALSALRRVLSRRTVPDLSD